MASDFAQTVKQQADIVRVVGDYIKLKKSGAQNYTGLCPFHKEKTGSFSVHATRQFYHCFGCGESGDVFSFVQKIENISFPEAVRAVAQKFNIALPKQEFSTAEEARDAKVRTALLDMHERACNFFLEQLKRPEAANAREYLAGRGLNAEMIAKFRIGFAPDSGFVLRDFFKGTAEELLKESGLFSWKETQGPSTHSGAGTPPLARDDAKEQTQGPSTRASEAPALARDDAHPESREGRGPSTRTDVLGRGDSPEKPEQAPKTTLYSKFRNRITFPICNEAGKVIAFTGRTLATDDKAGPKYLNSPETAIYHKGRVLFNLHLAKEAVRSLDYVILVEGQMDCISVFAAGFHNVIATSGTAFTEAQARLLGRYTKKVVVNFDPDTAGANATERTLGLLVEEDFQIKVLTLEPGLDPDLYVRKRGKEAYANALRGAQRYFTYLIDRARGMFPVTTPEGKVKALNFLLPHVHRVPSRIVRDELAADIAQKLGIDSAVLRQELKHAAATRSATVKAAPEAQITPAERILIRALGSAAALEVVDFDPRREAHYRLTNDPLHRGLPTEALIAKLLEADPEHPDPMSLELSDSERRLLATVLLEEAEPVTAELLDGALEALRRRRLERQKEELKHQIARAERERDSRELARLVEEKLKIDRELAAR